MTKFRLPSFTRSAKPKMIKDTIVVNKDTGVEIAYLDSGAPSKSPYTTIFAIHGMIFTNLVFQPLIDIAAANGVRVVAISRRPFPGSTALTDEESKIIMTGGTAEELESQIEARGKEIATFLDIFIQKNNLPPAPTDGSKSPGGIIMLGWSVGALYPLATLSASTSLPSAVQDKLGAHIRAAILYEPAPLVMGLPSPPENWTSFNDTSLPPDMTLKTFGQHCTAWFEHEDLEKKDHSKLSWVLPSTRFVPTIFTIPPEKLKELTVWGMDAMSDLPILFNAPTQLLANYRKAFYDPEIAKKFPNLTRSFLCGDTAPAWAIAGLWAVQADEEKNPGPAPVKYKWLHETNHFAHWVDPKLALDAFLELA